MTAIISRMRIIIKLTKSMKIKQMNWPKIQIIKLYVLAVEFLLST